MKSTNDPRNQIWFPRTSSARQTYHLSLICGWNCRNDARWFGMVWESRWRLQVNNYKNRLHFGFALDFGTLGWWWQLSFFSEEDTNMKESTRSHGRTEELKRFAWDERFAMTKNFDTFSFELSGLSFTFGLVSLVTVFVTSIFCLVSSWQSPVWPLIFHPSTYH